MAQQADTHQAKRSEATKLLSDLHTLTAEYVAIQTHHTHTYLQTHKHTHTHNWERRHPKQFVFLYLILKQIFIDLFYM